ncbi:helix-turn-helix transcriptional regulator [soil metagenome]
MHQDPRLVRHDESTMPVTAIATDHPAGHVIPRHKHPNAQLIHAVRGVMVVATQGGHWVVPPTRGLWMPPGVVHEVRMVGEVHMRSAFIRPEAAAGLSSECAVLGITSLLRELILAAVDAPFPYEADSRTGRLMRLMLDEVKVMPVLPLHLPRANDERLQAICNSVQSSPDDRTTLEQWSERLGVGAKTIQRQFAREFGLTFGQWRQQARLLAGLERLASGAKVLDVALDLGYDSPSAFTTMFKRQFGVTPSMFFQ